MKITISTKELLLFLGISIVLPNILIAVASLYLGFHRSYINLDYLFPFLLLAIRRRAFQVAGCILFVLISVIDSAMLLLEYFPTLNLRDIPYLLGFVFSADKTLIVLFFAALSYLAVNTFISLKYAKNIKLSIPLLVTFFALLLHVFIHLAEPHYTTVIKNKLTESRLAYLLQNKNRNFLNILNADVLRPSPWSNATQPWFTTLKQGKPLNKKLLLIIAESWGQPNNSAIQDGVLQQLKAKNLYFDFFMEGSQQFIGLTAQAELRELCRMDTDILDLREVKTGFQNCLPKLLGKQGYQTHGIHNATNFMYGRDSWYKLAGFKHSWFKENLNISRQCIPFDGVCDWDVLPKLQQLMAHDESVFAYWLTLTAHFYYAESDIHSKRFQCADYGLPKGDACRNLRHQAQFFDNLAGIISSPEMRGVEVIVVGDHVPPLFGAEDHVFKREHPASRKADVPWIHFRIKD